MTRVLVVEDEDRYRDVVARYLAMRGHDVIDTASGEEAVTLGLAHRPRVLVADWMLRRSVHGLQVAEALRTADPALHTVLVTGFPDSDLTVDRAKVGIVELLEKPFDVEALGAAVDRAGGEPPAEGDELIGVLLLGPDGEIRHANHAARDFLEGGAGGRGAGLLSDAFAPDDCLRLTEATDGWVQVTRTRTGQPCWARSRELPDGGRFVALCSLAQEWRREDPRVRMLLGLPQAGGAEAFEEPMLLVDDSPAVCDTFVAQVAARGSLGHAAPSHARALEILRGNPRIRIVVLDWAMPGEDLRATVAQMREIRPGLRLIGTSGEDRQAEFGELGIDAFILKPWTVAGELASLLGGRDASAPGSK